MKTVDTFGFKVYSDELSKVSLSDSKCKVVNTISPNSYGLTTKDEEFRVALQETDYLVLDGVYFALASILLKGENIKRNQGPDVFYHFINRLNSIGGRAFFLGSTPQTLHKIEARIKREYPNISVGMLSPPFKDEFSTFDNQLMIESINNFKPDIVFVGMTCPKQEKWAMKNKALIHSKLIVSIGNVFDWFAGTQKAIAPIWFKLRLGWLIRIFLRPEIFKRNIRNQMIFFKHLILVKLKLKTI